MWSVVSVTTMLASLMKYYYFRDYCDLWMDVELDVVCCVCDNNVGLFDEVLICQCCLNEKS